MNNKIYNFGWLSIIMVVAIGLLDLIGWFYNITFLKSILSYWAPMKMITAFCLLASAASIAISVTFRNKSPLKLLSSALAILTGVIGITTIDTYIKISPKTVANHFPFLNYYLSPENRMALVTAVLFLLSGIILVLINLNKRRPREIAHALLIPLLFIAYVVPVRYIIDIHDINTFLNIPIAFNTAVAFCFLSLAILCFYPDTRLMRVFTSRYAGSVMARRLLAGLLIIPVVIGWLRITGERINLYSSDLGVALVAVSYTFFLIWIVWLTAGSVNKTDLFRRNSEEKLLQSREQYRMLVEISPYAVFVNRDNKIAFVNPACMALFGVSTPQQIIGRSPFELFHKDSHDIVEARIALLKKGHSVPLIEEKIVRLDGSIREVEVAASMFTDQDGQAIQVILHDITEHKKSEAKLLKLNQTLTALDKCSQAMVRLDDENSFLKEVCQVIIEECQYTMVWIGYALEDADKTVLPMVHFGFDKGYLQSQHISWADNERGRGPTGTAIRTGKPVTCRNMLTDPNFLPWRDQALKRGYASSIALPLITNGNTLGALAIYSKVTDAFAVEEVELLTELANEVAYGITAIRWKIAQAKAEVKLKKYAEDLKELNATKDKFFGIIAHDLKNPFASILGTSEILADHAEEYDKETIKKFSILLHDAGKNGYAMLENLLEWSRSQTGRLSYNPRKLNVREVIQQDLDNVKIIADQKDITLQQSVPKDIFMVADSDMTHTILRNLLTNALKFTYPKGKVIVYARQDVEHVVITVKDNGIGIPEEEQKKLFKIDVKYIRIGTAEERGTGLGLLLCREFVEKQGGKIWVESAPGKGSSFIFTLPVNHHIPSLPVPAVKAILPEDNPRPDRINNQN